MKRLKYFLKKHEKKLVIFLLIVFSAVFLISAIMIALHFYEAEKSEKSFEELSELLPDTTEQSETEAQTQTEPITPRDVYASVYAQNDDFVGWIKIEGTKIDYPVVQSETRNYYLRRGFDKKYSYYGVPYAAEICDVDSSDNVVIYGHNMNNGSMFSDLEKYTSRSYYEAHKYISFDTLENFGTYEVIAVLKTVAYSEDEFEYFRFESGGKAQFDEYVAKCKELSLYDIEATAEYGDKLLTLSTCEYSVNHGRLAVVAKKIEE